MREILFRGKCKYNSLWICGSLISYSGKYFIIPTGVVYPEENGKYEFSFFEVYPETVGRLWKDDMYSGDVISVHQVLFDGEEVEVEHVVVLEEGIDGFEFRFISGDWMERYTCEQEHVCPVSLVYGLHDESFKKLGNIHDNPELLEEQE